MMIRSTCIGPSMMMMAFVLHMYFVKFRDCWSLGNIKPLIMFASFDTAIILVHYVHL